jgi:hypothetical protein
MERLVKEAIDIWLHPNNFNRDEGFTLSHPWHPVINIVTYSGSIFMLELYWTPKVNTLQLKRSRKLLEHTYTSDPHGTGTLTPIEFFQQDLLLQSSNTHSHSCSHKASKHKSVQSIVGLSVLLHTTTALRRIFHH